MDTVKQSMEDIRSRIGELPAVSNSKTAGRPYWPWDKIPRQKAASSSIGESSVPDTTNNAAATPQEKSGLCIGSIFGMDVGGTLAKLVYFEQRPDAETSSSSYPIMAVRERNYHRAASARAVLKARRGHDLEKHRHRHRSSTSDLVFRGRSFSPDGLRQRLSTYSDEGLHQVAATSTWPNEDDDNEANSDPQHRNSSNVHTAQSNEDLLSLYRMRQESVPDDLDAFASTTHMNGNHHTTDTGTPSKTNQLHNQTEHPLQDNNESSFPPASTMRKSRSMMDMTLSRKEQDHAEALDRFYHFAHKLDSYREGVKDHKLSFYSRQLGGEFHFIRFETRRMENAMELIRANDLHLTICEMGATGGGAHKYAADWERELGIVMHKQDELDSLVAGMQFVLTTVIGECYTFRPRRQCESSTSAEEEEGHAQPESTRQHAQHQTPNDKDGRGGDKLPTPTYKSGDSSGRVETSSSSDESDTEHDDSHSPRHGRDSKGTDEWWWSRKVQRDSISYASTYPYLLVTIGTGVSILRVDGPRAHERISGSTIGGGTYWGLIRLLTDLEDFEDVMRLAEHGDPSKVDMLVGDIYGKNSNALEKLGLPSTLVASSFGKLVAKEDPAAGLKQEDLARALLLMVTNNIGQVAYLNAQLHKTPRIYFVGNFLRGNKLSQRRLSFAINYWSKGEMEALFLEHEGYFGALGAFLLSQDISLDDLNQAPPSKQKAASGSQGSSLHETASHQKHRRSNSLEEGLMF